MALLSILSANNATFLTRINSNPRSFLNSEKINSLARKHNIHVRTRKTDYSILVGSSLELSSSHNKEHLVTIESLRQRYIRDSGVHISAKCFHNRLDQEGLAAFGLDLISSALKSHVRLCNHMQCDMYAVLMKKLGVDDIILVDGTEIAVRESMFATLAQQHGSSSMLSLLKVHTTTLFEGFFLKLITLRDSAYYEARNKLLKLILLNCQRTKPSLRDRHKLKDIVLLIK